VREPSAVASVLPCHKYGIQCWYWGSVSKLLGWQVDRWSWSRSVAVMERCVVAVVSVVMKIVVCAEISFDH
jgi:hypothetical protein